MPRNTAASRCRRHAARPTASSPPPRPAMDQRPPDSAFEGGDVTFFALVHGGAHGGWCWELLIPELERLGHECSAPDLPFDDPNGASEWADAVIATIPHDVNPVIVGHSLAGLCLPVI